MSITSIVCCCRAHLQNSSKFFINVTLHLLHTTIPKNIKKKLCKIWLNCQNIIMIKTVEYPNRKHTTTNPSVVINY